MRYLITETTEYTVEAESREDAENIWLSAGPVVDDPPDDWDGYDPPEFVSVVGRLIEEAP